MSGETASANAPSGTPGASGTPSGSASGAAPGTANHSAAASKANTPQPSASTTLPVRDKDSVNRILVERYQVRGMMDMAAMYAGASDRDEDGRKKSDMINDYTNLRKEYRRFFPPTKLYGEGYSGYGNGYTETARPAEILYPHQKPRPGKRTTPPLKYGRKDMRSQAEQHEELVPIRVDIDWDKLKLRDTFTFNLHERIISPEYFAQQMIEDMGLKLPADRPVIEEVVKQVKEQLSEFFPLAHSDEDALDPELPYSAYKNDEMRILVKLNITIGVHTLVDQFEWEINNPVNSPEDFAASMARDLSLSGEFTTAIAHCIREQCQAFTRSLYIIGHPFDGRPVEDPDIVASLLPSPLPTVFRPQQQAKDYAPYLYENTEAELERTETIFSREQRRQKRSVNRRGGPMLPDLKEKPRTIRTLIVSTVLPGSAANVDETRLYKRATGAAGRGKRVLREGELSDSEESEDSAPDSPALSQLQGTARTRGMRGAANVAAQRMANLGRSETPEATIHHHETRTSRRFGREATREMTEEPQQFIVTLKVTPVKLKKLLQDVKARQTRAPSDSATPRPPSAVPGSMGPPSTPSTSNQNLPPKAATPSASTPQAQIGAGPAPPPTAAGKGTPGKPGEPAPPPPEWLTTCLKNLLKQYPSDSFESIMRYSAVDKDTGTPVQIVQGKEAPPNVKFMHLPRIRCHDCPGKLYTPGPEMTVGNFEVHLKNRQHREKVDARVGKPTRTNSVGSAASTQAGGSAS
ncbi:SNF5-like protein [Thozetella sp. PMI_491]|nr:SNF5-like protein [Thozetella sp. PMI_491]